MSATYKYETFPEYLKSLKQVQLSETCEAILAEFRAREAAKVRIEELRKLTANTK